MAATSGPQAKAQHQSKRPVVDSGQSCTHRKGCRITDDKTSDRWPLCLAHKLMHSNRAKDYWWISKKALHTGNGAESLMTRHIYIYIYIKGSIKASIKASAQLQSKAAKRIHLNTGTGLKASCVSSVHTVWTAGQVESLWERNGGSSK